MKKYKYLAVIILTGIILIAAVGCKYNGHATIKVTNTGTLIATIRIHFGLDQAVTHLDPGKYEIFEFEWPGHGNQVVTYIRYPKGNDKDQLIDTLTLKDGDYLEFQVSFK